MIEDAILRVLSSDLLHCGGPLANKSYHEPVRFIGGQTYTGPLSDGCMEGRGCLQFPDGLRYEGEFHYNKLTGQGVFYWPDATYEGEFLNGQRHGQGRLTFTDSPVVYEGEWCQGMRHGRGKIYFDKEKQEYYEGQWHQDQKHGQGTMQYASGNYYTGDWVRDHKEGVGTMYWVNRGERYTGQWMNNLPQGIGEHVWLRQTQARSDKAVCVATNRYFGQWIKGQRQGEGVLQYSTGGRYEGTWENDKKHGEGVFVHEDGSVFVGQFINDRPVAAGVEGAQENTFGPNNIAPCLRIQDILDEQEEAAHELKRVEKVLVKYNSQLRTLYHKYSVASGVSKDNPSALKSSQMWHLALVGGLVREEALSMGEVQQLVVESLRPPSEVTARRNKVISSNPDLEVLYPLIMDPCDPSMEMMFRDFCEVVVRLAHWRYYGEHTLEERVNKALAEHFLPLLAPSTAEIHSTTSLTGAGESAAGDAGGGDEEQAEVLPSQKDSAGIGANSPSELTRDPLHLEVLRTAFGAEECFQGGVTPTMLFTEVPLREVAGNLKNLLNTGDAAQQPGGLETLADAAKQLMAHKQAYPRAVLALSPSSPPSSLSVVQPNHIPFLMDRSITMAELSLSDVQ